MSWFESPQYMKNIQKIKAMSPEDKALTQTLVDELDGMYADKDMKKQLQSMRDATTSKRMDRRAELGRSRLDLSGELGRGRLDLRGELGRKRLDLNQLTGQQGLDMRSNVYDFEKDQNDTAELLGYGNIALSGLRGYADMQYRKKLADELTGLGKKWYGG